MEKYYTSKYGKIIKRCPGIHEYWYKGKLIARGSSISSPDPREKPTKEDWQYCLTQRRNKKMKKIINGRRYDTQTAKLVGYTSYSTPGSLDYWSEDLYRKKTGEFFLHGQGGPMSKYLERTGENEWSYGHEIIPLSLREAQEWVEKYLDADTYEDLFGRVSEGKVQAATWVSEAIKGQIDDLRKEKGHTLVEIIEAGVKALSEK